MGIAMVAFGIQHLVYVDFVTRLVPKLPVWVPGHSLLALGFGVALSMAGTLILFRKTARASALLLGAALLASFVLLYLPMSFVEPSNAGLWVNEGNALALSGGAFLAAGTLPSEPNGFELRFTALIDQLEKFIPLGTYFLGTFFAYCGVLHFVYVKLVAALVPAWIPGHVFWTYFSGVALIAGGVGMNVRPTARLAAALSALMVFLWVVLLHIPRALAAFGDSNETTAVFEALAVAGAALLAAPAGRRAGFEHFVGTRPIISSTDSLRSGEQQRAGAQEAWITTAQKDQGCV